MRQVPRFTSYCIVGDGRLSRHLECYLEHLKLPFSKWARSHAISFTEESVQSCSHILLAISDDAIEDFILQHPFLKIKCLIHFSGALTIDQAFSAHPLMTFSDKLFDQSFYEKIPFVIEHDCPSFSQILPGLKNQHYSINNEMRPYYHALCVMAGNFPFILWCKVQNELSSKLNLPKDLMKKYLEVTLENSFSMGVKGLTGPLVRGDKQSISKHLKALGDDPFKEVYLAIEKAYRMEKL